MKTLARHCPRCTTGRMFLDLEGIWTCFACGHEVLPFVPLGIPTEGNVRGAGSRYDRLAGEKPVESPLKGLRSLAAKQR